MNTLKQSVLALTTSLFLINNVLAVEPDWKPYADLLSNTVKQGRKQGVSLAIVDYAALKENGKLEAVYQQLSTYPVDKLQGKQEKLAFYINTYNILALKTVVDNFPLESIKDVGNLLSPVWGKEAGNIGGKTVSLDDIENKVIRPMAEPRIHFAIVCASVSCPDLYDKPYTAALLNEQLNQQTQIFLNNNKKGLYVDKTQIHVSKIFDWFAKDFKAAGGIETFIRSYRTDLPALEIDADIDYNWNLNGKSP